MPLAWRTALTAAVIGLSIMATAQAQPLSNRPIFIIVPFTPGTGIDILARTIGEQLRQRWNQPVVVDNKPGASGNIGTGAAAKAAPNGHTILMTVNTFVMNASLYKTLPYDPVTDFEPIGMAATGALALTVHPSVPADSARAFIAHAKARPGQINYASPGVGTPQHLAMELFKLTAQVDMVHIPYKGSAGAINDVVAGHVSTMFMPVHSALPLMQDNRVRVLAVGSAQRSPVAPNVPTLEEQGVGSFEVDLWYGLLAPAGTPRDLIERYNAAINAILGLPAVRDTLNAQGLTPVTGPPDRLAQLIRADLAKWAKVVKDANITPE